MRERLAEVGLDERAVNNLIAFVREQKETTGHLPTDRTLVVERFRDELGDWRLVLHSPFGLRVHAPWALAVGARLLERYGVESQDRKSTRLNSSHVKTSYAVFCMKKKNKMTP